MLIDYHVHTNTSLDAVPSVREVCEKAVSIGMDEICITNHHELKSVWSGSYNYALNDKKIKQLMYDIEECREEFDLAIKFGVELGFYENCEEKLLEFTRKYPFDYVKGGIHFIDGLPIAREVVSLDADKDVVKRTYETYFRLLCKAIRSGIFDCIAHMDLPRKELPQLAFEEYKHLVVDCIKAMRENDIGFELNTGGWRRYHNEQYPRKEILKLLFEAGIRKVTIGSDSHIIDELGYRIEDGLKVLKEAGFKEICIFNGRIPEYRKIDG